MGGIGLLSFRLLMFDFYFSIPSGSPCTASDGGLIWLPLSDCIGSRIMAFCGYFSLGDLGIYLVPIDLYFERGHTPLDFSNNIRLAPEYNRSIVHPCVAPHSLSLYYGD